MSKNFIPFSIFLASLFFALLLIPVATHAKSVTFTGRDAPNYLGEADPASITDQYHYIDLNNIDYAVTYSATIIDDSAGGTQVTDGSSVTVGSRLTLAFTPHQSSDIYWFATGSSADSPYGEWTSNNGIAPAVACNVNDKINNTPIAYDKIGGGTGYFDSYIPFEVNYPVESITPGSNLLCGAPSTAGDGTVSENCIVDGAGIIAPVFQTQDTYAELYDRYNIPSQGAGCYSEQPDNDPSAYNQPMFGICGSIAETTPTGCAYTGFEHIDFPNSPIRPEPDVPAQTISFSFTATPTIDSPTAPTITGSGGNACSPGSLTFTATDPDNANVKYGIDWNDDGTVDQWLPASGTVPSGTAESTSTPWSTAGTYTIEALTQNAGGTNSSWTSDTVTVATCPAAPTATLTDDGPIASGSSANLSWSCTVGPTTSASITDQQNNVTTLSANDGVWSGTVPTADLTAPENYTLSCTGPGGSNTDDDTVSIVPPPAAPTGLTNACNVAGDQVSLGWDTNADANSYELNLTDTSSNTSQNDAPANNPETYSITPGDSYTWSLSAINNGGSSATTTGTNFTCNPPALPALKASDATPLSGTAGQSISLSGTVINTSAATTGGTGFYNTLQICDPTSAGTTGTAPQNCSNYNQTYSSWWAGNLAPTDPPIPLSDTFNLPTTQPYALSRDPNANLAVLLRKPTINAVLAYIGDLIKDIVAPPQAFASGGGDYTLDYRWCANENAATTPWTPTVVAEYSTQCGAWSTINVTSPAPTCYIIANPAAPTTINPGSNANITWNSTYTNSCTMTTSDPNGFTTSGAVSGGPETTGPIDTTGTYPYDISCAGQNGSTCYATAAEVIVSGPSANLSANPNLVKSGQDTALTWSSGGDASSCSITRNGVPWTTPGTGTGNASLQSSSPVTDTTPITGQTKYVLTCIDAYNNQAQSTAIVNIPPVFQNF